MNALQKKSLLEDAKRRSEHQPERMFYILIKENQGAVTPNEDYAVSLQNQGFKCYAKMKDGSLTL